MTMLPERERLERLAYQVASIMRDMSEEVVGVIAHRLDEVGTLPRTDVIRLANLARVEDMEEIARIMARHLEVADAEVQRLFALIASENDEWAEVYYRHAGVPYAGYIESPAISAMVANAASQTVTDILSMSGSSAFAYGGYVHTIGEAYRSSVNRGVAAVVSGVQDYRTVVKGIIKDLSDSGLRAVQYAPGSRAAQLADRGVLSVSYPSGRTMRLDSAVRMNVLDGFRMTLDNVREIQGNEFGADGVEVSAHGLCAPDHQPIQGRQYYKREFALMDSSLARPIGTLNCQHSTSPVIVGVSSKAYTDGELSELNRSSNARVTWNGVSGKEMSASRYEATQYQRKVESAIRTKRSEAAGFEAAGDLASAKRARGEVSDMVGKYRSISGQMGLEPRMYRTR